MARLNTEQQFKFLISCIRYSNNGKIDFDEVARECGVVSKGAAAKRYERLMKAHNIHQPANAAVPSRRKYEEDSPPATAASSSKGRPAKKQKRSKKQDKFINDDETERDDEEDEPSLPVKKETGGDRGGGIEMEKANVSRERHLMAGRPFFADGNYPFLRYPEDYPLKKRTSDPVPENYPLSKHTSNPVADDTSNQPDSDLTLDDMSEDNVFKDFIVAHHLEPESAQDVPPVLRDNRAEQVGSSGKKRAHSQAEQVVDGGKKNAHSQAEQVGNSGKKKAHESILIVD